MPRFARAMSLGLFIAVAAAGSAVAQYSGSYRGASGSHWRSASAATSNLLLNRSIQSQGNRLRQGLARTRAATPAGRPAARGKAAPRAAPPVRAPVVAAPASATRFTSVAPSIVPRELALASGNNAARQREMRSFFEECLVNYEKDRRQKGLPIKDVAMAVGYFIGVSYNVYHGGNAVSPAGGEALRAQVRQALVEDEDFGRLPDAEKQRIYETMAVMGEFIAISASVADTNGNKELKAMARDLAKDNLERLLQIPVSRVRITNNGIAL